MSSILAVLIWIMSINPIETDNVGSCVIDAYYNCMLQEERRSVEEKDVVARDEMWSMWDGSLKRYDYWAEHLKEEGLIRSWSKTEKEPILYDGLCVVATIRGFEEDDYFINDAENDRGHAILLVYSIGNYWLAMNDWGVDRGIGWYFFMKKSVVDEYHVLYLD